MEDRIIKALIIKKYVDDYIFKKEELNGINEVLEDLSIDTLKDIAKDLGIDLEELLEE